MIFVNKILVDADFIYWLLREKNMSICEGDCDSCIFNPARLKYKVSCCDEFTPEQLFEASEELYRKEKNEIL